jgi:hypothetical protein
LCSGLSNIEILIALPDGGVRSQQFMPQDLGQEDVVGHVLRLKLLAADGSSRRSASGPVSRKGRPGRRRF